jgi:hypothetical protein
MDRDEALNGLVDNGVLTAEQAQAVRDALGGQSQGAPRWLAEAAGYVGGALMLGGASVLLATQWEAMTRIARTGSLAGITLVLLIAAGSLALVRTPTRRRVAGVLAAIASVTAAGAAGVFTTHREWTAAGVAGLAVAILGYAVLRNIPTLLAIGVHTTVVAGAVASEELGGGDANLMLLSAYVLAGAIWFTLSLLGVLRPEPLGLGIAGALAIGGGQFGLGVQDQSWWGYGTTFLVALVCFGVYRFRRTPVLLVGGVTGAALAAPEAVWVWTDGAAGGAVILLVAGAALIGASALSLRLARANPSGQAGPA